jgi:hypothetical protein
MKHHGQTTSETTSMVIGSEVSGIGLLLCQKQET